MISSIQPPISDRWTIESISRSVLQWGHSVAGRFSIEQNVESTIWCIGCHLGRLDRRLACTSEIKIQHWFLLISRVWLFVHRRAQIEANGRVISSCVADSVGVSPWSCFWPIYFGGPVEFRNDPAFGVSLLHTYRGAIPNVLYELFIAQLVAWWCMWSVRDGAILVGTVSTTNERNKREGKKMSLAIIFFSCSPGIEGERQKETGEWEGRMARWEVEGKD